MQSNVKVQNPSDLCLVLLVGGIYLSGGKTSALFSERSFRQEKTQLLRTPRKDQSSQKRSSEQFAKKDEKGKDRRHIVLIFRMQQQS